MLRIGTVVTVWSRRMQHEIEESGCDFFWHQIKFIVTISIGLDFVLLKLRISVVELCNLRCQFLEFRRIHSGCPLYPPCPTVSILPVPVPTSLERRERRGAVQNF
jgi:hypothetical protein